MLDIFCEEYNSNSKVNGYNAPYQYSLAKRAGKDTDYFLKVWHEDKKTIFANLIEKLQSRFSKELHFVFIAPPSRTQIFTDDIRQLVKLAFLNSIDASKCFLKSPTFAAVSIREKLSEGQLRSAFALNENCENYMHLASTDKILLVDDVFEYGNTFNALRVLIRDINPKCQITTAAILKINQ